MRATIHTLANILTVALRALVSMLALEGVVWPSYCLLCGSYIITLMAHIRYPQFVHISCRGGPVSTHGSLHTDWKLT